MYGEKDYQQSTGLHNFSAIERNPEVARPAHVIGTDKKVIFLRHGENLFVRSKQTCDTIVAQNLRRITLSASLKMSCLKSNRLMRFHVPQMQKRVYPRTLTKTVSEFIEVRKVQLETQPRIEKSTPVFSDRTVDFPVNLPEKAMIEGEDTSEKSVFKCKPKKIGPNLLQI